MALFLPSSPKALKEAAGWASWSVVASPAVRLDTRAAAALGWLLSNAALKSIAASVGSGVGLFFTKVVTGSSETIVGG